MTDTPEYTGGKTTYYMVDILSPTDPEADPYTAECQDIIEALGMNFNEGNAFKALWRRAAARLGKSKRGYTDGRYDAEKVAFYGQRLVEMERLAALAQQNEWLPWDGSQNSPVPRGTLVDVRYCDGDEAYGLPALMVSDTLSRNGHSCGASVWESTGTNWITHWRKHRTV